MESDFCQTNSDSGPMLEQSQLSVRKQKGFVMKRIDAIIRPHQLDEVKSHLTAIGVEGITISEVRGFGRQKGHTEVYRGTEYSVELLPKIQITVLASDELAPKILEAITEGARTGKIGDGKIFVTALEEVVRIRTGDRGEAAL
jgi:nitrogen regulatory protein PII